MLQQEMGIFSIMSRKFNQMEKKKQLRNIITSDFHNKYQQDQSTVKQRGQVFPRACSLNLLFSTPILTHKIKITKKASNTRTNQNNLRESVYLRGRNTTLTLKDKREHCTHQKSDVIYLYINIYGIKICVCIQTNTSRTMLDRKGESRESCF